jgi:pimeloyl-ACP methyl ester carboxylesterase
MFVFEPNRQSLSLQSFKRLSPPTKQNNTRKNGDNIMYSGTQFLSHNKIMEPVEIEMIVYAAIAYPDICEISNYTTPVQYERYKFGNLDIWRHSKNSRTAVITLSGGCRLKFCQYIQKLVDGLDLDADIYGLENYDTFNFCCVGDIVDFIRSIDYDNLIVMGFSMGGILGSHVLAQLNGGGNRRFPAKLIVIGTPFNINNSSDILASHVKLYHVAFTHLYYKAFRNSLDHNRGTLPTDVLTIGNYDGYARFIERMYSLPNFRFLMKINPNIPNCRVISFYNNREIVARRAFNVPDVEQFKSELDLFSTFEEYAFDTWVPGHNSEWAQETNLQIIVKQIRSVLYKKM